VDAADFVIRLIDKATAPAKKISAAFAGIQKSLEPVTGSKAFKALDKAGDKLFDFGKSAVIAGGLIGVGVSAALTKAALDAAMFGENTKLAFERLTGSSAMGEKAFATVVGLVDELGLDLHDTTDGMRKLLAAQFSLGQSTELLKMSADLSAIGIHGEEAARVLTALSQIKAKGKVQTEELMQLAEAGISLKLVQEQLAKATGKSTTELQKMLQAGKVSSDVGLEAIQAAVKQKLHIHEFGEARKAFVGSTLTGLIESLKAQSDLLFLKLGGSIADAAEAMKPLLQETADWVRNLDTSNVTEVVKTILATIVKLVPLAREFFSGFLEGFGALAGGFQLDVDAGSLIRAAEAGKQFAEAIGTILDLAKMAGKVVLWLATDPVGKVVAGFGLFAIVAAQVLSVLIPIAAALVAFGMAVAIPVATVVGLAIGIAALTAAIMAWWPEISSFFEGLWEGFVGIGSAIVQAIATGMSNAVDWVIQAATNVGTAAVNAVKDAIGMHSPPQEFIDIGVASTEAFGMGQEKGAPGLQSASARATAGAAMAGAAGAASGGGGGEVSIVLNVNVDGSGKDSHEIADEVVTLAETRLAMALERFANPSPAPA
jgi:tape measure domain-containing protein